MNGKDLREIFEYKNGLLYWKEHGRGKRKNLLAGSVGTNGYVNVFIDGRQMYAHRIIYIMKHDVIPESVDHINGNRSDNRIENLRACSQLDNNKNMPTSKANKSGIKNVSWYAPYKKWRVAIRVNGRQKCLGYFDDVELASVVAYEARDKYRGEFANHV